MGSKATLHQTMRIYHRYLGFFLAGIMAVYALSGILLIFRDTGFLKQDKVIEDQLKPGLKVEALGKAIRMRELKIDTIQGDVTVFKNGTYNMVTGAVRYTKKVLPPFLDKLTHLHKAGTKDPLFFLNVFFGTALLFFVISSFWMFLPHTRIFRKGLLFVVAGVVLVIVMLLV